MPACALYCEVCGSQEVKRLRETEFAILLAEGIVEAPCAHCQKTASWKLVLPPRRPPEVWREPRSRRLLLIDDDLDTLHILQLMLRPEEYAVETASSADEAMQKLQTGDFDALVCDIRMPGFDGRSLYRFLATFLPYYADKVVFLTGDQSEKTLRFLKECGCPYTFKPIDLSQLQSCIRQVS